MLKLTYTENGFRMEHLTQSLEDWVKTRLILALRSATSLMVEPTTASFLLPADLPYLEELEVVVDLENMEVVIAQTESDYVEVSLPGTWVTSDLESAEGIFVSAMSQGGNISSTNFGLMRKILFLSSVIEKIFLPYRAVSCQDK